jgi:nucleotide-binding universal stress UspA family protein
MVRLQVAWEARDHLIADDGDDDAIVIGSRGRGAVGRVVHGRASGHVATRAEAPVIVAR